MGKVGDKQSYLFGVQSVRRALVSNTNSGSMLLPQTPTDSKRREIVNESPEVVRMGGGSVEESKVIKIRLISPNHKDSGSTYMQPQS